MWRSTVWWEENNSFVIEDTIENTGDQKQNFEILYHMNMGYPLLDADGKASIYQPKLNMGLEIRFDAKSLDGFVEWKMMGVRDYVLGLECGNCYPDGRSAMRKSGMLKELAPGEKTTYRVRIKVISE